MKNIKSFKSYLFALASGLALVAAGPARAYTWAASGYGGAGTQNGLAIQGTDGGVIVSAADVSGPQRSTDGGKSWQGCNMGMPTDGAQRVAAVAWDDDPANPHTVYAGAGNQGADGGFFISNDDGVHWSQSGAANAPQFDGNGSSARWPRSTGNLIVSNQSSSTGTKFLYAGACPSGGIGGGVMRSTDDGSTWRAIGFQGTEINALALDPNNKFRLFAATNGQGVYYTNSAGSVTTDGGWIQLTGPGTDGPAYPMDLLVLNPPSGGSLLYIAGANSFKGTDGTGGVWIASSSNNFATPTAVSSTYLSGNTTWTAIAGYMGASKSVLFAGAAFPQPDPVNANDDAIVVSTDGGANWAPVTLTTNTSYTVWDSAGPVWWQDKLGGSTDYLLGHDSCGVSNIQVDPKNHANVIMAGRSGNWGTRNATASAASMTWYPYMGGYGGTGGLSVSATSGQAVDPNNSSRLYIGDADWSFLFSTDSGATFQRNVPLPTGHGADVKSIFVDPATSAVYVARMDNGGEDGEVYSNTDGTSPTSWVEEGLATVLATDGGLHKVQGVASGVDSLGNTIILAMTDQATDAAAGGLWRGVKHNTVGATTAWTQMLAGIYSGVGNHQDFSWNHGSKYVYVYTQASGLWRSTDHGSLGSWSNIWPNMSSTVGSGSLVGVPGDDNTVYVSVNPVPMVDTGTDAGVYRLDNAETAPTTHLLTGGPVNPGVLSMDSAGNLYCANNSSGPTVGTNSTVGSMTKWTTPKTAPSATTISDSTIYPGQARWPAVSRVNSSGKVFVGTRSEGIIIGSP